MRVNSVPVNKAGQFVIGRCDRTTSFQERNTNQPCTSSSIDIIEVVKTFLENSHSNEKKEDTKTAKEEIKPTAVGKINLVLILYKVWEIIMITMLLMMMMTLRVKL